MGKSDVRAAVGTIAAFMAAHDIYKSTPSVQRDVAGVLTQAWWARQMMQNVVTTTLGSIAAVPVFATRHNLAQRRHMVHAGAGRDGDARDDERARRLG